MIKHSEVFKIVCFFLKISQTGQELLEDFSLYRVEEIKNFGVLLKKIPKHSKDIRENYNLSEIVRTKFGYRNSNGTHTL